jgi:hypothetical protein
MQKEAKIFLENLKKVKSDDSNIIGYLNLILDDYINFFDFEELASLIEKMKEIVLSSQIDIKNATNIQTLIGNLNNGDIESFYDSLEEFQKYNEALLSNTVNLASTPIHR